MAISSKSKLREIVADERAVSIIDEYVPGFMEQSEAMGPCMGMKIDTLLKFPQVGIARDKVAEICERLDALDA